MDYEKVLKDALNNEHTPFEVSAWIEEQFPELAESEDERTWIINYLNNRKLNSSIIAEKENLKKAIAWLEKQGETFTKKDIDDAYLKGVTDTKKEIEKQYEANYQIRKDIATFIFNYRGDIKDRAKWIDYLGIKVSFAEKQGEQKPILDVEIPFGAKDSELQEASYHIPEGFHAEIKGNKVVIKKGGQKPVEWLNELDKVLATASPEQFKEWKEKYFKEGCVWSEEDDKMLSCAEEAVKAYFSEIGNEGSVIHWLKSLKDRVQPQPKQEWSEYDEYEIGNILSHLKACLNEAAYSRYEKYLKPLRPQKHWKPSDEQMKALSQMFCIGDKHVVEVVSSLYKDLKKLKD